MRRTTTFLCILAGASLAGPALPYSQPVHKIMAARAFNAAVAQSSFMQYYGWSQEASALRAETIFGAHAEDFWGRSLNHFFDLQNSDWTGIPLSEPVTNGPCKSLGKKAPQWALQVPFDENAFGLDAAHQYMWGALTGPTSSHRSVMAHLLFRSLGQMVHLLQDMAQPEHTRNDQHFPKIGFGDKSGGIYEAWTLEELFKSSLPDGTPTWQVFMPKYPEYCYPAYTGCDPGSQRSFLRLFDAGFGMASYATMQFVTQDTNYGDQPACVNHVYPRLSNATPREQERTVPVYNEVSNQWEPKTFKETVYSYPIKNNYNSPDVAEVDNFHAFHSLVDLESNGQTPAPNPDYRYFSLNGESYQSRVKLLVPRAVGASAEFIRHFFRNTGFDAAFIPRDDGTYDVRTNFNDDHRSNSPADRVVGGPYSLPRFGVYVMQDPDHLVPLAGGHLHKTDNTLVTSTVPQTIGGVPIYRKELRVVFSGTDEEGGDDAENGYVTAVIYPPKNEIRVLLTYDPAFARGYDDVSVWVTSVAEEPHYYPPVSGFTNFAVRTNGNFTSMSGPSHGTVEVKMGLSDNQEGVLDLRVDPSFTVTLTNETEMPGPARLVVYRNGALVHQEQWFFSCCTPPMLIVSERLRITGAGVVEVLP